MGAWCLQRPQGGGGQILWDWSYKSLSWYVGAGNQTQAGAPNKCLVLLTAELSLQTQTVFLRVKFMPKIFRWGLQVSTEPEALRAWALSYKHNQPVALLSSSKTPCPLISKGTFLKAQRHLCGPAPGLT